MSKRKAKPSKSPRAKSQSEKNEVSYDAFTYLNYKSIFVLLLFYKDLHWLICILIFMDIHTIYHNIMINTKIIVLLSIEQHFSESKIYLIVEGDILVWIKSCFTIVFQHISVRYHDLIIVQAYLFLSVTPAWLILFRRWQIELNFSLLEEKIQCLLLVLALMFGLVGTPSANWHSTNQANLLSWLSGTHVADNSAYFVQILSILG